MLSLLCFFTLFSLLAGRDENRVVRRRRSPDYVEGGEELAEGEGEKMGGDNCSRGYFADQFDEVRYVRELIGVQDLLVEKKFIPDGVSDRVGGSENAV